MRGSNGFTLLETAIVLVITGLLLSGILKGQEMIGQARAKSVVNDLTSVNSATLLYFDRYKTWPGDDPNAGGALSRWQVFNARSGDGDGTISGNYNEQFDGDPMNFADGVTNESLKFWWHLRIAGYAHGPLTGRGAATAPVMPTGGILGVQGGHANFFTGLMACVSNVPARIATSVDTQLDDQRPNFGTVRGRKQRQNDSNPPLDNTDDAADYIEDGTTQYVLCRSLQLN
jgi:prepilin-type N-terminal cleavage/methylation domain-containing protein